jgi:hypothetical protein
MGPTSSGALVGPGLLVAEGALPVSGFLGGCGSLRVVGFLTSSDGLTVAYEDERGQAPMARDERELRGRRGDRERPRAGPTRRAGFRAGYGGRCNCRGRASNGPFR